MYKKIALCLHGGISYKKVDYQDGYTNSYSNHTSIMYEDNIEKFVNFTACYKSIKKHIIDYNTDYDIDIYIHMWHQNEQMKNEIIDLYKPQKYIFEDNKKIMKEIMLKCVSFGDKKGNGKGRLSRLYSMCKSLKMVSKDIDYDLVISYRPDMLLWKDIDLNSYDRAAITKNGSTFGDFHFIMSMKNSKLFSNYYDNINKKLYDSGYHLYKNYIVKHLNLQLKGDNIEPNKHQEVLRKLKKHSLKNKSISDNELIFFGLDKNKLLNEYDTLS